MTRDELYLIEMLEATRRIEAWTQGLAEPDFLKDERDQSAVAYQLVIVGELAKRLSDELRERHADIEWSKIARMRDRLVHQFHENDPGIIWNTAVRHVPRLAERIISILTPS